MSRYILLAAFICWSAITIAPLVWLSLGNDDGVDEQWRRLSLAWDFGDAWLFLTLVGIGCYAILEAP